MAVRAVAGLVMSAAARAALAQGGRQRPLAGAGAGASLDDAGVSPAEIQRMFDAYALMQAQEQLKISDDQFTRFLTRFKALQDVRRRNLQERTRLVNEPAPPAEPGQPDEMIRERLKALDDLEARSAVDVKKAYDAIDQVLDVRQQAKFRVFEEHMERRKLELVMRARQGNSAETSVMLRPRRIRWRVITATVACCRALGVLLCRAPRADVRASKRDAALLKQKVATITAHAEKPTKVARRTTVTENEVNSYLVYEAREQIPVGVVDPSVTILGTGRVSGRAVVDLDAVRKQKNPTSLLDPMNYLMGRLPVTATGRAEDEQRRRPLRARVGERRQRARSRRCSCRRSSATTRARPTSRPASASTIRLRCRRASARSRWSGVKP